ncbi:hypothetical protein ACS0TY_005825 [Phlomoides rotata]
MAPKSPLLMLVLLLAVTRMGTPVEGDNNVEAPMYPPMDAPIYAPFGSPDVGWSDAPTSSPLPYGFGTACVAMCSVHCHPIYPRRRCMRTCTACCAKSRCVPEFSPCCAWDTITVRGYNVQCP